MNVVAALASLCPWLAGLTLRLKGTASVSPPEKRRAPRKGGCPLRSDCCPSLAVELCLVAVTGPADVPTCSRWGSLPSSLGTLVDFQSHSVTSEGFRYIFDMQAFGLVLNGTSEAHKLRELGSSLLLPELEIEKDEVIIIPYRYPTSLIQRSLGTAQETLGRGVRLSGC